MLDQIDMAPDDIRAAAVAVHERLEERASPKAVAVLIGRLFVNYRAPDLNEREAEWLMEDLISDLSEFSVPAIAAACAEWRRTQKWRPTIAELRELCIKHQQELHHQSGRALIIAGAKRAGWDVIKAIHKLCYISEEYAASVMESAWQFDRKGFDNVMRLAAELPQGPPDYTWPSAFAFSQAIKQLRDADDDHRSRARARQPHRRSSQVSSGSPLGSELSVDT
jgi:hypothetical protein